MSSTTAVYGLYKDRGGAKNAVEALKHAGFHGADISVLFPDNQCSKDFARDNSTEAPEGALVGAGPGAIVGGALGWLAGAGLLAILGVGPFLAAGPIIAMMAGVGVGGTVGSLVGGMVGMGMPELEAQRYEGRIREGNNLLSAHCDNQERVHLAQDVLRKTGAEDVAASDEALLQSQRSRSQHSQSRAFVYRLGAEDAASEAARSLQLSQRAE